MRRKARENAIKYIFENLVNGCENELTYENLKEEISEENQVFYATIIEGVKDKFDFIKFLNEKYNVICYVCGEDYRFGKFGSGNVDDIKRYAKEKEQDCIVSKIELYDGIKISTSRIKQLLTNGTIEKANLLLALPYFIEGTVFSDRKVGRNLGFPTINVKIDQAKHHLKDAVYTGHICVDNVKYKTIINYGARPTFDLNEKLIEAHIVDFSGDLYGKKVRLYFDKFLRDIQKFTSRDDLVAQLKKDLIAVKG